MIIRKVEAFNIANSARRYYLGFSGLGIICTNIWAFRFNFEWNLKLGNWGSKRLLLLVACVTTRLTISEKRVWYWRAASCSSVGLKRKEPLWPSRVAAAREVGWMTKWTTLYAVFVRVFENDVRTLGNSPTFPLPKIYNIFATCVYNKTPNKFSAKSSSPVCTN